MAEICTNNRNKRLICFIFLCVKTLTPVSISVSDKTPVSIRSSLSCIHRHQGAVLSVPLRRLCSACSILLHDRAAVNDLFGTLLSAPESFYGTQWPAWICYVSLLVCAGFSERRCDGINDV